MYIKTRDQRRKLENYLTSLTVSSLEMNCEIILVGDFNVNLDYESDELDLLIALCKEL